MDCSIIPSHKYAGYSIISTTDFFYPLVEDPYIQGRIAACNVLSDMYALGVVEVDNVLMLLAQSLDMKQPDREICTRMMILGFDDLCKEAGTVVSGGQTVVNPWPIIGGVAKSICKSGDYILPVSAAPGDVLVLTKWLGTQLAVNVKQWMSRPARWEQAKKFISVEEGNRAYHKAMRSMTRLNKTAAILMHKYGCHAATDVTGFGIIGHARSLCLTQKAEVSFVIHTLPIIRGMMAANNNVADFKLMKGLSSETSGGMLACLPKENADAFIREIEAIDGFPAWIVGEVVAGKRDAMLAENVKVIEV